MTWPLSKTFVAANGTNLTTHDASWVLNPSWSGGVESKIYANRAIGGTNATRVYYYNDAPPSADMKVSATVHQISTDTTLNHGVLARLATGTATGYMARYRYGTGVQLFKYTGSTTGTQLGSTVAGNLSNGDSMDLDLECIGSAIKVFKDGVEIISVTDSAVVGPGYAGIWLSGDGAGSIGSAVSAWSAEEASGGSVYAPPMYRRGGASNVLLTRF